MTILSNARSVFRSIDVGMASRTVAAAKQRSRPQKNVSVEITDLLPRIGGPGKRTQDMAGCQRSSHPQEHVSTM